MSSALSLPALRRAAAPRQRAPTGASGIRYYRSRANRVSSPAPKPGLFRNPVLSKPIAIKRSSQHEDGTRPAAPAVAALWPASAAAQSAIGGQVSDDTGGILPGVTVEAASPALIEGSRVAVTDGQGRYSIINLRPGLYSLTFTLAGFGTVVQEGIDLPSEFTAEVDARMSVGALEETVTVSGEAPVVDVQQAARVQVLSREVLDNVVNTGSPWTQAMMVPGVSMAGIDVGGSRYVNDLQLEARGANAKHTTVVQDGMTLDLLALEGVPVMYNQDLATQEMAVQAGGGGGSAEMQAGGVVMNIVPKEGGNIFSGQGYFGHTAGGWIADNYSDRLRQAGDHAGGRLQQAVRLLGLHRGADPAGPHLVPRVHPLLGRLDPGAGLALRRRQPVLQRRGHHLHRHPHHLPGEPDPQVQHLARPAQQAARPVHRPAARVPLPGPVAGRPRLRLDPVGAPHPPGSGAPTPRPPATTRTRGRAGTTRRTGRARPSGRRPSATGCCSRRATAARASPTAAATRSRTPSSRAGRTTGCSSSARRTSTRTSSSTRSRTSPGTCPANG